MFGPVSRIASRLLTRRPATTRTRAADPLRCRPRLESLDGRIVPSVDVWQSTGDTDFTNTANWSLGRLPGFGDDVVFDGGSSPVSCSGLWGMTTYNSFSMVNGYSGTVSVLYGIQAYTVTIASGALDQGGTDLDVLSQFTWTGGVLNSTANEATVNILGDGTITLPTGGTLNCGSALNFANANPGGPGVTTTISGAGTLNFTNGSPVTVDAGSSLVVAIAPGATAKFDGPEGSYTDGKAKIELKTGGSLTVSGAGTWEAGNRTLVNNGGSLEVKDGATATFGSNAILGPPVGTPLKTDILQNTGQITVYSGSTLTSAWGAMEVKGGSLFAKATGGAAGTTSTIGCQLTVSGGTVRVLTNIGTLNVAKDFYWTGGTFQATVDCAAGGGADQITVDKKLYVGGTATLQVVAINVPAGGLPANFLREKVINAKEGIANVVPNMAPSLAIQNPVGTTFQLNLVTDTDPNKPAWYNLTAG